MYEYYKYAIITLILCISTTSFASGNLQNTTNNFNFKNISASKNYGALEYGVYDPAKAIEACKIDINQVPEGGIWPADPSNPFPPPEPAGSDCEINSQMAYGCTNYANYTGSALTKSVVGIMIRHQSQNSWYRICTGTVIDNQWVLTAAHCVVDKDNSNLISASRLIVVPWQDLHQASTYFGVPTKLSSDALGAYNIIKVKAVNISRAYSGFIRNAYSPDLALLKIEPIKPYMGLEPISVVNTSVLSKPETSVITGGYGRKEDQKSDGQLRYRKSYYMTNMYDSSWHRGVSNNYGNIYILGSKPIDYKGEKSAWRFIGSGDSGAPVLSYNHLAHKFQIEGVHSGSLFCNYAGYFAKLPYPYSIAASTTYYPNYNFIKSVMNGASDPSQVRCNGECYFQTVYVVNQTSNDINGYKFDDNNGLLLRLKTPTGVDPTQIAFRPGNNMAFVTNYISNSISQYEVNSEGGLAYQQSIYLPEIYNGPIDIAFLSANYMVVLARNSHSLLKYGLNFMGSWYFKKAYPTLMNPTHLNIIQIVSSEYLLLTNEHEIAVYEWNQSGSIVNTYDKLELTSYMGRLIEIKPFGEFNNPKLYVLTTNGIYIYQLNNINGHLTFTLIGNHSRHYATERHVVPLYANSFAISDKSLNLVLIYEVAQDNTIMLENHITMPGPGEMAFDNGILYINSFPRSLYSYTISYPHLYISSEPKIVETGDGPTIVKIGEHNFKED